MIVVVLGAGGQCAGRSSRDLDLYRDYFGLSLVGGLTGYKLSYIVITQGEGMAPADNPKGNFMILATSKVSPTTNNKNTVINAIAQDFAAGEVAKLGIYLVACVEAGWDTMLVFTHRDSGETHRKLINSDGPTHAADQAWDWWTKDAWYV